MSLSPAMASKIELWTIDQLIPYARTQAELDSRLLSSLKVGTELENSFEDGNHYRESGTFVFSPVWDRTRLSVRSHVAGSGLI